MVELNPTRDAQIDPLVLYWVVHRPSGSGITLMYFVLYLPCFGKLDVFIIRQEVGLFFAREASIATEPAVWVVSVVIAVEEPLDLFRCDFLTYQLQHFLT